MIVILMVYNSEPVRCEQSRSALVVKITNHFLAIGFPIASTRNGHPYFRELVVFRRFDVCIY